MGETRSPTERTELTVHERDPEQVAVGLAGWLSGALADGGPVEVVDLSMPESGGLSSVSVLFRARWAGGERDLVVRLPPEDSSFPVFPAYDLTAQGQVMNEVAAHTDVPVPAVVGLDPAGAALGVPFLVMERVLGEIPPDNPPYVFGGWVADATPQERARMTRGAVAVLADIHQHAPVPPVAGDALWLHVEEQRAYYEWTRADTGLHIPVIEDAFAWLEERWPISSSAPVRCWGDARIGNIAFTDFTPSGVLDWEMATVGPPEMDLAWLVFLHRFFQDIATVFELPGIPDLLRRSEVEAAYAELTGHQPVAMEWFTVYAALRHAIVMHRIKHRMIHFGQDTAPEDPDDYVMHQVALRQLMAGTYDWGEQT